MKLYKTLIAIIYLSITIAAPTKLEFSEAFIQVANNGNPAAIIFSNLLYNN